MRVCAHVSREQKNTNKKHPTFPLLADTHGIQEQLLVFYSSLFSDSKSKSTTMVLKLSVYKPLLGSLHAQLARPT